MSRIEKRLYTEIRDQLGYYPTWPIGRQLELGLVGYLNNRYMSFDWVTSLNDLGFNFETPPPQELMFDEMYATESAVNYSFEFSNADNLMGNFKFKKGRAFTAQGYKMVIHKIKTQYLNKVLLPKIQNNDIEWDKKWVIITELFHAGGFTLLVGGKAGGEVSLSANVPKQVLSFNTADIGANIQIVKENSMSYRNVCAAGATPYFYIHKLVTEHGQPRFRRYSNRKPSGLFSLLNDYVD